MAPMQAPDKIYINGFSAFATVPVKEGIEYIRKDALLEWVKERKRYYEDEILRWGLSDSSQATTFVSIASIKRLVYEVVIDKLNEM